MDRLFSREPIEATRALIHDPESMRVGRAWAEAPRLSKGGVALRWSNRQKKS